MANWDAIILELMQEHGLPIPKEPENEQILDGMLHERRLKALIAESKMPVIPRKSTPPAMCNNFNRLK